MGTAKGERRRQALVVAAAELLLVGGFDAVRHRAVAERAGLPLASTTYYFASLEQLITTAVEYGGRVELAAGRQRLAELGTAQADAAQPFVTRAAAVELVLDLLLGSASRDGGLDAVLLRFEQLVGTGRRPYLAPLMRALRAELDELLTDVFVRSGIELDAAGLRRLVALVDGTVVSALIEADPDPRAAAREMLVGTL